MDVYVSKQLVTKMHWTCSFNCIERPR